jgi:hypothetical protein
VSDKRITLRPARPLGSPDKRFNVMYDSRKIGTARSTAPKGWVAEICCPPYSIGAATFDELRARLRQVDRSTLPPPPLWLRVGRRVGDVLSRLR